MAGVLMYSGPMRKKRCTICAKGYTDNSATCSPECAEALHWKQYSLDRHRKRSKTPGVYRVTVDDWKKVLNSFNHRCAYCGKRGDMTIDHVLPLSRGGRHCVANLVPACLRCNLSKGSMTIVEWKAFPAKKAAENNNPQSVPWTVDARMGVRPVRKKYKPNQTPIFSQLMEDRYNQNTIERLHLTVDHFGVLMSD